MYSSTFCKRCIEHEYLVMKVVWVVLFLHKVIIYNISITIYTYYYLFFTYLIYINKKLIYASQRNIPNYKCNFQQHKLNGAIPKPSWNQWTIPIYLFYPVKYNQHASNFKLSFIFYNPYLTYLESNFDAIVSSVDLRYDVKVPLRSKKQSVNIQPARNQDNNGDVKT